LIGSYGRNLEKKECLEVENEVTHSICPMIKENVDLLCSVEIIFDCASPPSITAAGKSRGANW